MINIARLPKCKSCHHDIIKDDEGKTYIKKSNGYYHIECLEAIEQEKKEREELIEYIKELYGFEYPPTWMLKQIKDFRNINNYKYTGMLKCLEYIYEVKNLPLKEDAGLGLIGYKYDEAKKYYIDLQRKVDSMNDMQQQETQIITTNKPRYKPRIQKIDISEL